MSLTFPHYCSPKYYLIFFKFWYCFYEFSFYSFIFFFSFFCISTYWLAFIIPEIDRLFGTGPKPADVPRATGRRPDRRAEAM